MWRLYSFFDIHISPALRLIHVVFVLFVLVAGMSVGLAVVVGVSCSLVLFRSWVIGRRCQTTNTALKERCAFTPKKRFLQLRAGSESIFGMR